MFLLEIQESVSLNSEGMALLEFRARVEYDPCGAFSDWNPNGTDSCMWLGVHCVDGKVKMLDLSGFSLEGILAPEIGKLSQLRYLVLYKNRFSGFVPKEFGGLTMLEVLDLRNNNLSGIIPAEISKMLSLKHLLLSGNNFQGSIPPELEKLNLPSEQLDENLTSALTAKRDCMKGKFGHSTLESSLLLLKKVKCFITKIKGTLLRHFDMLSMFRFGKGYLEINRKNCSHNQPSSAETFIVKNVQHVANFIRRRLLEASRNLPAAPASGAMPSEQITPVTVSSGTFPALTKHSPPSLKPPPSSSNNGVQSTETSVHQPSAHGSSKSIYIFVGSGMALLLILLLIMFLICRNRGEKARGPWIGLSGKLQTAFVTGVPKLNGSELEAACENFCNLIDNLPGCTVYKGTLSSGVEIAVASTTISSKNWSEHAEKAFRKKIDTLSRLNHKNFVNLLGYCEEDEPFMRMMVFEYAPNGTLYDHLHGKEVKHLDWNSRLRIIMGIAYCLQSMHHEMKPPLAHPNLQSNSILLTDDFAAKIAEIGFWTDIVAKSNIPDDEEESQNSNLRPEPSPQGNVYSFGVMLLEIISGKVAYNEEQGSLVNWAADYLNDKRRISYMIDPTLESFENNELDTICEVIQECINLDVKQRPTMREITSKLRDMIGISPDAAIPKVSPMWWAELEILSVEAR